MTAVASERLYARLDESDVRSIESVLTEEEAGVVAETHQPLRKTVLLVLGVHHRVPAVLSKTGLSAATPPGEVHAMSRGPLAAGGTPYYADLVVDALGCAGMKLEAGMTGLDFGCSSGRVVRVLAAAYPDIEWHGCDPIASAILWARQHLTDVSFELSPQDPPLPYEDGSFDFAFAVSVWSHFAERAALAWFAEMHRIIRVGGCLMLTTHGPQSVAHYYANGLRTTEQLAEIADALYHHGYWFAPEFGEQGDHGLVHPDWGTAFWTTEWLLSNMTPAWRVVNFAAGRAEQNQDMLVLERR